MSVAAFAAAGALGWIVWGQSHLREIAYPAREISVPPQGAVFAMPDYEGRPLVDLTINGKGPYRFIFDTGAEMTVVSPELRDELALPEKEGASANLDGRKIPLVRIDSLKLGDAHLSGVTAFPVDLTRLLRNENPPRGVLCAMSFAGNLVTFDYPKKEIRINPGALAAGAPGTFEYPADRIVPSIPVHIGGETVVLELDTGAASGLTLPNRYLETLRVEDRRTAEKPMRTAAGEFAVTLARSAEPVSIGGHELTRELQFSDSRGGGVAARGTIGFAVLRQFTVTLDAKNHRLRLQ